MLITNEYTMKQIQIRFIICVVFAFSSFHFVEAQTTTANETDSSSDHASSMAALVEMEAIFSKRLLDVIGSDDVDFLFSADSISVTSDLSCASSLTNSNSISLYLSLRRSGRS